MADKTLTAANAVIILSVPGLIPAPVQLQGFTADDIFDFESVDYKETTMGVDGHLSAGYVHVEKPMSITLQADSDSNLFFDTIAENEEAQGETFFLDGHVVLTAVGGAWTMTRGVLKRYQPAPSAKKILQPRTFGLVWESVRRAAI